NVEKYNFDDIYVIEKNIYARICSLSPTSFDEGLAH
ncbi:MAG: hypothetical protein RLZ10_1493, partial [Bacteroidota bacterium]